jgi:lipopolysaccharide export LptBFGC system permease protein LptF
MRKLFIPMMVIAICVALYEQNKSDKNVYIIVIAIAFFMFGMMKLSAKTPSKNQDNDDENV